MHWGVYVGVIVYFIVHYNYKKVFGTKGGKEVLIHLYHYTNGEPIFDKTLKGYIKKRFKYETDEQLLILVNKKKLWTAVPDSKFSRITRKGQFLYSLCLDGEDHWLSLDKKKYQQVTEKYEVPILDEKGNEVFEDVYERDDNDEIVMEKVLGEDKKPIMKDGEYVLQPKKVQQKKTKIIEVEKTIPSIHEQIIESDVKLYYLNKKQELREKYKLEQNKSKWEVIAPYAIMAVVVIASLYLSFNHLKAISEDTQESVSIFQKTVESMSSGNVPLSGNKDSSDNKPANYGQKEGGG